MGRSLIVSSNGGVSGSTGPKRLWAGVLVLVLGAVSLLVLSPSALASKSVVDTIGSISGGEAGGLFRAPRGVAVNQTGSGGVAAGTFYVVDSNNARIQQFNPVGEFVRAWGWGVRTGEAEFETCSAVPVCHRGLGGAGAGQLGGGAQAIAVDGATGNVYVSDQGNRRIDVFTPAGSFAGAFGWGARTGAGEFQFCTAPSGCHTAAAAGAAGGQFGSAIGGLAVDPVGDLYVADKTNRRVDVFKPTLSGGIVTGASFLRAFGWDVASSGDPGDTAPVNQFEVCTTVCQQGAGGAGVGQFASSSSPSDVAVDSTGNVFALDFNNRRVQQFSPAPAPVDASFGSAALTEVFGTGEELFNIAIADDHVYVSGQRSSAESHVAIAELAHDGTKLDIHGTEFTATNTSGLAVAQASLGGNIYASTPLNPAQAVFVFNEIPTIDAVASHTGTTAVFSGDVVSNGIDVTYHFEYSADGGEHWSSFPVPDEDAGSGPSTVPVSVEATGLTGSQSYLVRLVQNRPLGGGRAASVPVGFETDAAAPAISGTFASQQTDTTATLNVTLDPQNQKTSYHFEYVDDAGFTESGFAHATSFPVPDTVVGPSGAIAVNRDVGGLQATTTYHFRMVASNSTGPTIGEEAVFTTFPSQAVEQSCPNAVFRTGPSARLPDCRVYELVSPADSNGLFPFSLIGEAAEATGFDTTLASTDGDSVLFYSEGTLPGAEGNGTRAGHEAIRTAAGWETREIGPTGAQSYSPGPGGVTPDHEYAFWQSNDVGGSLMVNGEDARYIRTPDGSFELIGKGSLGLDPRARGRWMTAGGTHVIFSTEAGIAVPLEPGAPEAGIEAIYDRAVGGATHVVSLLPGEATPIANAEYRGASEDGSAVVFTVEETMYERRDDAFTVQIAEPGTTFAGISRNGDRVFYEQAGDVFACDAGSVGCGPGGNAPLAIGSGGETKLVNISPDGSRVYFVSPQQLDGSEGEPGLNNLYLWDGSAVRFIAVLASEDLESFGEGAVRLGNWVEILNSTQTSGSGPGLNPSRTTANGSIFVFQSHANLTAYEGSGHSEIYRYDADSGDLACLSCNQLGEPAVSEAELQGRNGTGPPTNALSQIANVTSDGQTVFFETSDALVPVDENGAQDVYEWHAGHLSLISSGHGIADSHLYAMTADGHDVFFSTNEALVPQDENGGSRRIYDARIGGGFASAAATAACTEDACQGSPAAPPALASPASSSFHGRGNPKPRRHAHKHKRRHHKRRHHRATHNPGGAK